MFTRVFLTLIGDVYCQRLPQYNALLPESFFLLCAMKRVVFEKWYKEGKKP
jgi:hypothetical protein